MPFVTTADACDREAAFLNLTSDGLPVLPLPAGGVWDNIQAYVPRTPANMQKQIWVVRPDWGIDVLADQRSQAKYALELRLRWPITSTTSGNAEAEQRAFDLAINDVVTRVLGTPPGFRGGIGMDKTHDGKFLAVAEGPNRVRVQVTPADEAFKTSPVVLTARIFYVADDYDFNN